MLKYYHKYFLVTQAQKNSGQKSAAFHCVLYSAVFPELPASAAFPPPGCRPGLPAGSSEISPAFPWLHVLRASVARWRGPEQISAAFPELRPSGASRSRCRCPDRSPKASRTPGLGSPPAAAAFPVPVGSCGPPSRAYIINTFFDHFSQGFPAAAAFLNRSPKPPQLPGRSCLQLQPFPELPATDPEHIPGPAA